MVTIGRMFFTSSSRRVALEEKKLICSKKWNLKWVLTSPLILLRSALLPQHVKSYIFALLSAKKAPNKITFSFSWEFQLLSFRFGFIRFYIDWELLLLSLTARFCFFFFAFYFLQLFAVLRVSFGYTIQRLFIIQFSFYSDAKRRSSTWNRAKRNLKKFSASTENFSVLSFFWCGIKNKKN